MAETRTSIRFPPGWHDRVRRLARRGGRSVHAEILRLIGRGMELEETEENTVTLRIDDDEITSPDTPHTAHRVSNTAWLVTWLPRSFSVTRNQAITAMTIASTVGSLKRDGIILGSGEPVRDPVWPHLKSWAGELGVDAAAAVRDAGAGPRWEI